MKGLHSQKGMTAIGWMMVLALIAFFVTLTLKLAPAYLEYTKVKSIIASLESEPLVTQKPAGEIRKMISRRMSIDDVKIGFEV